MLKKLLRRVRSFFISPLLDHVQIPRHQINVDVGTQILLSLKYKELLYHGVPLPDFDEVGFMEYSSSNEDGILLYIFALLGTTNKKLVDIGAAGIEGSNVANLLLNHGWVGLLIDANTKAIAGARMHYENAPDVWRSPPTLLNEFVTAENINDLLRTHGFIGDIDLLSIDIDGMDYWIWQAIDCITPKVVVVEVHDVIGPDRALTVPYQPNFTADDWDYGGASLPAFVKLAKAKGYRLVGCSRFGINAFFIREGIGESLLPEISVHRCFQHPRHEVELPQRWAKVKDRLWVEV